MIKSLSSTVLIFFLLINSLYGETLFDMKNIWNKVDDSSSTISVSVDQQANKIEYDFKENGQWVSISKQDFGGDSFSFYLKGTGSKNNLQLQLYDEDGDIFSKKITGITDFGEWVEIVVPFSSMECWKDISAGDLALDSANIKKMGIAVNPNEGGQGAVFIDSISRYQLQNSDFLMVSSFDFGSPPNEVGGDEGPWAGGGASDPESDYVRENAYQGAGALSLNYDISGGGYNGYYIFFSTAGETGQRDCSSYDTLRFWTKSDYQGRKYKIKLKDDSASDSVQLADYLPGTSGTTTDYQEVVIPKADLAGVDWTKLSEFVIVFNQTPSTGTVYIDSLRFTKGDAEPEGRVALVDSMDSAPAISGWKNYGKESDKGLTDTSLISSTGKQGNAIGLDYSFNRSYADPDDWVVMEREWGMNLAGFNEIQFDIKGEEKNNNLEFKITDKNGTVYWKKLFSVTDTSDKWKTVKIPYKQLSLFEKGKDSQGEETTEIDMTAVRKIEYVISRSTGGAGVVYIKNLRAVEKGSIDLTRSKKIIKSLETINNPFSPNGDGHEDSVYFVYTLSEPADVGLNIYDLEGNKIYEYKEFTSQTDTEMSIEWKGRDNNNERISNGIYFFQIIAETSTDSDEIKNLVAVFR